MSFSSMSSMIFGFLPCFGRLNKAWCSNLGLVGPGFEAELEKTSKSRSTFKGETMVASYVFLTNTSSHNFQFDIDMLSHDKEPATWSRQKHWRFVTLEVLTSSHSWLHQACSPWPSKCMSPVESQFPRDFFGCSLKKDSFRNHVGIKPYVRRTHEIFIKCNLSSSLAVWRVSFFGIQPTNPPAPKKTSGQEPLPSFPPCSSAALPRKPPGPGECSKSQQVSGGKMSWCF